LNGMKKKEEKKNFVFVLLSFSFFSLWYRLLHKHTDKQLSTLTFFLAFSSCQLFYAFCCLWVYIFSMKYIYVNLVVRVPNTSHLFLLPQWGRENGDETSIGVILVTRITLEYSHIDIGPIILFFFYYKE